MYNFYITDAAQPTTDLRHHCADDVKPSKVFVRHYPICLVLNEQKLCICVAWYQIQSLSCQTQIVTCQSVFFCILV